MNINSLYKLCDEYYKIAIRKVQLNKEEFNRLRTVGDRNRYLREHGFRYIAEGSSRAAYVINNQKILKMALNLAGIAQNQVEFSNLRRNPEIFPKVYDKAPDDSWIEVEYVRLFKSMEDVAEAFGMSYTAFTYCLGNAYSDWELSGTTDYYNENNEFNEEELKARSWWTEFINNAELMKIVRGIHKLDLPMNEFWRTGEHWGRAGDGRIVITDAGFSIPVSDRYYNGSREPKEDRFNYPAIPGVVDRDARDTRQYITQDPKNYLPKELGNPVKEDMPLSDSRNYLPPLGESQVKAPEAVTNKPTGSGFEDYENSSGVERLIRAV